MQCFDLDKGEDLLSDGIQFKACIHYRSTDSVYLINLNDACSSIYAEYCSPHSGKSICRRVLDEQFVSRTPTRDPDCSVA